MCDLQDASRCRINQVGRSAFASHNPTRSFDRGNQRLEMKFSIVSYVDDTQGGCDRSSGIQKLLLAREIDVIQTGTGND